MRFSWSVQSMVRSAPSPSAMMISSPIGVARRSMKKSLSAMVRHPEMLGGIGVPRPPGRRHVGVYGGDRLAVPFAGRPQAGPLGDQRRQLGILREMAADGGDVGAEIEHPLHPRDDGGEGAHLREADRDRHRI